MPKLKPIKDAKELAAIPLDEPVLVELEPAATGAEPEQETIAADKAKERKADSGVQTLEEQLQASKEAERRSKEAEHRERERALAAERAAHAAREEAERAKTEKGDTEKELLSNSLSAAQAEEGAAQAELEKAFEAGDGKGIAAAQAKIARAAARVVQLEGAIAQFDDGVKESKRVEEPVDIMTAIDRDPKLLATERDWLKQHPEVLTDANLNRELAVGYERAMRAGHRRGSDAYFKFLNEFMGYAESGKPDNDQGKDDETERSEIVSAPVTRDSRSSLTGRPTTPTRITLTPEQREIARSMGLTDVQYARGVVQLDGAKKADPTKFAVNR